MKVNYIKKVMSGVTFDKLKGCIDTVHEKSNKPKALIFADMAICAAKYGAGYYDYTIFEFYNLNGKQRKTYMTRFKNKKLMTLMNNPEYADYFDKKDIFYENFSDYIGRGFLVLKKATKEDVIKFVEGKEYIIAKPRDGECGHGIEKIKIADFTSKEALADYVFNPEKKFDVIEDLLIQHEKLNEIYPHSINCLRIATILHEGKPHVLYAVFKTGNNGNFVDNLESGGYACHVDLKTGKICGPAHTSATVSDMSIAEVHSYSGVKFEGFEIPMLKEACELCERAALVVPEMKYIGWDVAITENGPAIVEGNNYCAYDFPQLPDRSQQKIGFLKQIEDLGIKL